MLHGDIDMLHRPAQRLRNLFELPRFEQAQLIRHDLPGHAAFAVDALDLQQQAFPQIARADAGRIERLHHPQRLLDVLRLVLAQRRRSRPATPKDNRPRPGCR